VLHDSTVPLFGIVRSTTDGVALIARKEWHPPEPGNEQWHYGVTLYRVVGGTNMGRVVEIATTGARGTDSLQTVDATAAQGLKASGVDFVIHYLGTVTSPIVDTILNAGLAFMPVTRADRFDGPAAVAELAALGLPSGCAVWLDVEAVSSIDPTSLKQQINSWAEAIIAAGFEAGLYVGAGCPLTSVELYQLKVTRYWKSQSKVIDRNGQLAEPGCGWCMIQLFPSITWAGVLVDVDAIQQDYRNRLPSWTVSNKSAG
jgi:Domain of unknown function (DUF1906)